jgi:flagellar hook-associated protein 2
MGVGVASIYDFGFDIDKTGKLSFDATKFDSQLDANSKNVEAFFSGGDYTNANGSITTINGAFTDMSTVVEDYTKYNRTLDLFKNSITDRISSLEDDKTAATARLDSKYAIMKKQWSAYDSLINKTKSASDMFTALNNPTSTN